MKKQIIIGTHPAFGEVTFTISAEDAKSAFSKWKQFMLSSRQWSIQRNVDEQSVIGVEGEKDAMVQTRK